MLGEARLSALHRWRSVADSDVELVLGSGADRHAVSPFAILGMALSRRMTADAPAWRPHERMLLDDALATLTSGSAQALFAEKRIGRIAKGLEADFLFIDRDPLVASPDQLAQTRVLETWIGGVKVYDAGSAAGRAAIDSFEGR